MFLFFKKEGFYKEKMISSFSSDSASEIGENSKEMQEKTPFKRKLSRFARKLLRTYKKELVFQKESLKKAQNSNFFTKKPSSAPCFRPNTSISLQKNIEKSPKTLNLIIKNKENIAFSPFLHISSQKTQGFSQVFSNEN